MNGLCGSNPSPISHPDFSASSLKLPTASTWSALLSQIHRGSGDPQYLSREIAQSMLFVSHSPNRPDPISGGFQFMRALRVSMASLNAVVLTNHDVRA